MHAKNKEALLHLAPKPGKSVKDRNQTQLGDHHFWGTLSQFCLVIQIFTIGKFS